METTKNEKFWTINDIERITEDVAQELSEETVNLKEHKLYFIDFKGYFGYSVLVFKDGHHIYHANDYQIHHGTKKTKDSLREWYLATMENKLFTEEEIAAPLKDYSEYTAKSDFLHNYYTQQREYISMFRICANKEEEEAYEKSHEGLPFDPVGFCYMKDEEFIKKHVKLHMTLEKAREDAENSFEYFKNAVLHEMFNHEYSINWQADYDVLSAFGNITFHNGDDEVQNYFKQLKFTDMQIKAYMAARKEYYKRINEEDPESTT